MRHLLTSLLALWLLISGAQAARPTHGRKYALVVGISQYEDTRWPVIHGANDAVMLQQALQRAGFTEVRCLQNEQATLSRIRKEMNRLVSRAGKGDTLYLHFSGHGQPVEDADGDETDNWDQAFVPYDAPMTYTPKAGATGRHLVDDELFTIWKHRLCPKLGAHGLLVVCIDACFSGGSARGSESLSQMFVTTAPAFTETGEAVDSLDILSFQTSAEAPSRGWAIPYSPHNLPFTPPRTVDNNRQWHAEPTEARMLMMESCASNQKSREILGRDGQHYGPLSFAVARALGRYLGFADLRNFRAYVLALMQHCAPRQQMVTEKNFQ